MSLEQSIENLIKSNAEVVKAMNANTAALKASGRTAPARATRAAKDKDKEEPTQPPGSPAQQESVKQPSGESVTLQQVRDGFTELQMVKGPKEGRQACVDILSRLGVTSSKDIDPRQYPAAKQYIDAALGGANPADAQKDDDDGFDI